MPATATTTILYTVMPGDTLSKLALRFYGNAQNYPTIANYNEIDPTAILPVGARLKIPNVPNSQVPDELSEVAVIAQRLPTIPTNTAPVIAGKPLSAWLTDWRVLVGGGLIAVAVLYYLFGRKNR